jgi:hypothetical protein
MAAHEAKIIDHATLVERVAAGTIRGTRVIGQPGGWRIVVKDGRTSRALAARRGSMRVFKRFETLVGYLRELGLERYDVDASAYAPEASSRRRPDTAKRMERIYDAAEHDRWFRAEVQGTLDGIERGAVGLVPRDEHRAGWRGKRARLLGRARRSA